MRLPVDTLRDLAGRAVDLVLPPRCPACGAFVPHQGDLCAGCWAGLSFLDGAVCDACGRPLSDPGMPTCAVCLGSAPVWDRARGALRYDDASARLILGFKNAGRLQAVDGFARWMARAGAELLEGADLLVPVPLHRWRLWRRGYNQSLILARAVSSLCGRPAASGLLLRPVATGTQKGRGGAERVRAVTAAAFAVPERAKRHLAGRRVVLVDDVLTTGATLGACATVLRAAGASHVDVLVLARVVQAETFRISLA